MAAGARSETGAGGVERVIIVASQPLVEFVVVRGRRTGGVMADWLEE
jgi:hypothetical protein